MSDPRDDRPADYEIPQDNDGRLLLLGLLAGVGMLALLVAAGFGIVSLVIRNDDALAVTAIDDAPPTDTVESAATEEAVSAPDEDPQVLVAAAENEVELPSEPVSPIEAPTDIAEVTPPETSTEAEDTTEPPAESAGPTVAEQPEAKPTDPPGEQVAAVTPETATETTPPSESDPPSETTPSEPEPPAEETPPAVSNVQTLPDVVKPAPAGPELPPASGPLVYRWVPGQIHSYSVSLSADREGQQRVVTGNVELTVDETQPRQINADPEDGDADGNDSETGTGTGFVVSADGYLVTCAHVVQGATRIEVQLGDRKFEATVMAVEPDDDLALLRIDAKDLSPLSLADSDQVKLGEEIRAVGFPLSTVLGDGVKATSGTIAGIVQREDGRRLQVDAAINPGNSGGPIVNTRGQVLGVASSKLVGLELTGVGFCVPARQVTAMLAAQKVKPATATQSDPLDGPALVAAVTPSVALITVSSGPVRVSGRMVKISTSGSFRTKSGERRDPRRPNFNPFASLTNTTFDRGSMVVGSNGHVGSFESPNQLPFLAGPMGLLAVHPFDSNGRSSWTVRERITVTIQQSDNRFGPGIPRIPVPRGPRGFGSPFRPPSFNPFGPKEVKKMTALEVHQYRITSDSDDEVMLEKTFALTTLDDDTNPYFQITGTGEVKFSRVTGLVESFTFNHNFTQNGGGKRVRVPVTIKVEREPSEVVAARKRDAAVKQAKAEWTAANKAASEKVEVSPEEKLDNTLAAIESEQAKERGGNVPRVVGNLAKLKVIPDRQPEVEGILLNHLVSSDSRMRREAIGALKVWGSANVVPDLVALMSNKDRLTATAAIATLGIIGDKSAAQPLLDKGKDLSFRYDVQRALIALGPVAEADVIARMEGADRNTVQILCDVLAKIGSDASLETLEELSNGGDFFRKTYADRALPDVRKRAEAKRLSTVSEGETLTNADLMVIASMKTLNDAATDEAARMQAMADLVKIQNSDFQRKEVAARLVELLQDPSQTIRDQATRVLLTWATEDSAPALLNIALQEDSALRKTALQTLTRIGTQAETSLLVDLLSDPEVSSYVVTLATRTGIDDFAQQQIGIILQQDQLPTARKRGLIDLLGAVGTDACLATLDGLANAPQASTLQYTAAKAATKVRLRAGIAVES